MQKFYIKKLFLFVILFSSFEVNGKTTNVLKLSCEYDPNLIKKETKNINSLEFEKLDTTQICRSFSCKDIVEVYMVDLDDNDSLAEELQVRSVPTFYLFHHKELLGQCSGADITQVHALLKAHMKPDEET